MEDQRRVQNGDKWGKQLKKNKTTFSYHALIYGSYVSFYVDLYSQISNCWASASLIGEAIVHDVEVLLSSVIDADIRPDYQSWQTLEE